MIFVLILRLAHKRNPSNDQKGVNTLSNQSVKNPDVLFQATNYLDFESISSSNR